MVGLPRSVQVSPERFVTSIPPSREPAAPCIDPTARSCADVHVAIVVAEGDGGGAEGLDVPPGSCLAGSPLNARTPVKAPAAKTTATTPTPSAFRAIRRRARLTKDRGTSRCEGTPSALRRK